jgi:uncharacterized protein (DUF885 family)
MLSSVSLLRTEENAHMRLLTSILLGGLFLLPTGCGRAPARPEASGWDAYVERYLDAYFAVHPDLAVAAGRHEFDGKLPDFSRQALDREAARLRAERQRTADFSDSVLDSRQRFERDYLMAAIDGDLFWLDSVKWPYRNPAWYASAVDPQVYLTRPYASLDQRMRAFVGYEHALPAVLTQIRANLRTPLPRTYIEIGRLTFGGLAQYFEKDVPGVFAPVKDAALQAKFRAANANAIRALRSLDDWFESEKARATDTFAIGAGKFQEMLGATERVDVPLDQVEAAGKEDLARNLARLREACAQFAPGKSLSACVASANANRLEGSPVEAARAQLRQLQVFVLSHNLVTIPGTEEAKVDEAPPYQRWNFAYINIPGPYEKNMPSTYYISPADPKWSAAEQAAYVPSKAVLLFTSAHEVMPGHFLQFLHANRSKSMLGRIFVGYAFAEGWAHYAEEMMWDAGLGSNDPGVHIGELTEALVRDVRFVSAIGMHAKQMSVEQSERLFRESAFQDPGNARQQAARGTFDPAYLNYTLGKLMIRKLRDDWTASRGGRNAWSQFHDQFLAFGGPPIPLVRIAMLGASAGPPL